MLLRFWDKFDINCKELFSGWEPGPEFPSRTSGRSITTYLKSTLNPGESHSSPSAIYRKGSKYVFSLAAQGDRTQFGIWQIEILSLPTTEQPKKIKIKVVKIPSDWQSKSSDSLSGGQAEEHCEVFPCRCAKDCVCLVHFFAEEHSSKGWVLLWWKPHYLLTSLSQ